MIGDFFTDLASELHSALLAIREASFVALMLARPPLMFRHRCLKETNDSESHLLPINAGVTRPGHNDQVQEEAHAFEVSQFFPYNWSRSDILSRLNRPAAPRLLASLVPQRRKCVLPAIISTTR